MTKHRGGICDKLYFAQSTSQAFLTKITTSNKDILNNSIYFGRDVEHKY